MILITIGSNLPLYPLDSQQIVCAGLRAVNKFATVVAKSSLYESPAWPDPTDPLFINAAAILETPLAPRVLLAGLHAVEDAFSRRRAMRNAPRTLDLDLVAYDGVVAVPEREGALQLPHPRALARDFVLAPIAEIVPGWRAPGADEDAQTLLRAFPQTGLRRLP